MDVIVKWRDGTENCVSSKDLKCIRKGNKMRIGAPVKMLFKRKWYYGIIVMTEKECPLDEDTDNNSESSSDELLANIALSKKECNYEDILNYSDDSLNDPDYNPELKKKRKVSLLRGITFCDEDNFTGDLITVVSGQNVPFNHDNDFISCDKSTLSERTIKDTDNSFNKTACVQQNIPTRIRIASFSSDITVCVDDITDAGNLATMQTVGKITVQENVPENFRLDAILSDQTDCSESIILSRIIDDPIECIHEEIANGQIIPNGKAHTTYTIPTRNVEEEYRPQYCEVNGCDEEVFSTCVRCFILLCWHHFETDSVCDHHLPPLRTVSSSNVIASFSDQRPIPEDFAVEGAPRQINRRREKCDKRKITKKNKDFGKEYSTQVSKKVIPERKLGPLCNTVNCKRINRDCHTFSEDYRQEMFKSYWALGSLTAQREFIARHIEQVSTKQKTAGLESRRQNSVFYYFYLNGEKKKVCRSFFLSTLGIGETITKTVLKKLLPTGILEKDMRGGRKLANIEKDERAKAIIEEHIKRFPKVESHYCRVKTTREYLNSDLTIRKMHSMMVEELSADAPKPSLSLYRKIFKSKNLSFHRPKKDQCSICSTYRQGTEEVKHNLQEKYAIHIGQKQSFRYKRSERKGEAQTNTVSTVCATFDMQQVINLPISSESAVFYKRRLSVYNFTIYEMVSHDCYCCTWHEGQSKRGASEIATALYLFLKNLDEKGVKKVYLFADGCSGQNKNSIVASALLYFVNNSVSIDEIILSISVPCHGQNEGDSAHSAIDYAIKKSGDIFIPSQLIPIMKLARRRQPYKVKAMNYSDFLDFKKLSQDLRLLSVRKDNEGETVDWRNMAELSFLKTDDDKIFYKTDHTAVSYRFLSLRRQVSVVMESEILPLNLTKPKISQEKYNDLIALTTGDTPVIRLHEFVEFYHSLPH